MAMRKRLWGLVALAAVDVGVLAVFCLLRYLDASTAARMYLPLFLICSVALLIGWPIFAWCLNVFALLGLAAEFLTVTFAPVEFSVNAAFLNAALMVAGAVMGAAIQLLTRSRR